MKMHDSELQTNYWTGGASVPSDAAAELCKALVERQQLAKRGEALRDNRGQVAHVIHQLPLQQPQPQEPQQLHDHHHAMYSTLNTKTTTGLVRTKYPYSQRSLEAVASTVLCFYMRGED